MVIVNRKSKSMERKVRTTKLNLNSPYLFTYCFLKFIYAYWGRFMALQKLLYAIVTLTIIKIKLINSDSYDIFGDPATFKELCLNLMTTSNYRQQVLLLFTFYGSGNLGSGCTMERAWIQPQSQCSFQSALLCHTNIVVFQI